MTIRRNNLEQKGPEGMGFRDYARNVRLLRALPQPPVPAELSDPAFLEGIYERAAADDLGQVLADALPPRPAPEEVAPGAVYEAEARDRPELEAHLRGSRAPGWLWQRVQADLRRQLAGRRRHVRLSRFRVAAAAAVLLMVGAGLAVNLGRSEVTTQVPEIDIQVVPVDQPLGRVFYPTDLVREIAK